jgi:hypothetical protein
MNKQNHQAVQQLFAQTIFEQCKTKLLKEHHKISTKLMERENYHGDSNHLPSYYKEHHFSLMKKHASMNISVAHSATADRHKHAAEAHEKALRWAAHHLEHNEPMSETAMNSSRAADEATKRALLGRDLTESAPPDMEDWVLKNKARFKKEYGEKKGEEILYATAWKLHNKKR